MDDKLKLALEKSKDVNTLAEMKAIFAEQGIELTDKNLSLIFDKLTDYKNGKLSDEALETIAGGSLWDDIRKAIEDRPAAEIIPR